MNYMIFVVLVLPFLVPLIARVIWPRQIKWQEWAIATVCGCLLSAAVYATGVYSEMSDVEILNGQVLSKKREHDSYRRSYSCNCRTNNKGHTSCSTCYETRYTVEWTCNTTLGSIRIDKEDSGSRLVYLSPDPKRYTAIQPGDPVAQQNTYMNYIKAAPDSLFHHRKVAKFERLLPKYPDHVYDIYKINRVLPIGFSLPASELQQWNHELSLVLRKLGPQKQANAVVVMVNTNDLSYVNALESHWLGGKKNDVIVVIGTTTYPNIDWVSVISWTDNQLFKVQLRDEIMSQGTINRTAVLTAIDKHVSASFKRKSMKDFEYLKTRVEPPVWVLIVAIFVGMISAAGLSWYFYHHDPF